MKKCRECGESEGYSRYVRQMRSLHFTHCIRFGRDEMDKKGWRGCCHSGAVVLEPESMELKLDPGSSPGWHEKDSELALSWIAAVVTLPRNDRSIRVVIFVVWKWLSVCRLVVWVWCRFLWWFCVLGLVMSSAWWDGLRYDFLCRYNMGWWWW